MHAQVMFICRIRTLQLMSNLMLRLSQLVRFLVVELIHSDSNLIFDMSVVFTANYFLVENDIPIHSDTLLVTDFVNLRIKLA
jgi:hypothetical protein